MDGTPLTRLGLVVHPRRQLDTALDSLRRWSDGVASTSSRAPGRRPGPDRGRAGRSRRLRRDRRARRRRDDARRAPHGRRGAAPRAGSRVRQPRRRPPSRRPTSRPRSTGSLPATGSRASCRRSRWSSDGAEPWTGVNDLGLSARAPGRSPPRFASTATCSSASPATAWSWRRSSARAPTRSPRRSGPVPRPCNRLAVTPLRRTAGRCPPLVAGAGSALSILLDPGHGGARVELDGRVHDRVEPHALAHARCARCGPRTRRGDAGRRGDDARRAAAAAGDHGQPAGARARRPRGGGR